MPKQTEVTETELEQLFTVDRKRPLFRYIRLIRSILIFSLLYALVFSAVNFGGLWQNLNFWYKTEFKDSPYSKQSKEDTVLSNITSSNAKNVAESALPSIPDNSLYIGAIDVKAPISWRIANTEPETRKYLSKGLIHINGTALPGEIGNVFITGHSSDLPWRTGEYKTVFVLLNRLVVGDVIQIKFQNRDYLYIVSDIKTVKPTDVWVMEQGDNSMLSLMTCTPVGTTLRRLVVAAKQVFPDPNQNTESPAIVKEGSGELPRPR